MLRRALHGELNLRLAHTARQRAQCLRLAATAGLLLGVLAAFSGALLLWRATATAPAQVQVPQPAVTAQPDLVLPLLAGAQPSQLAWQALAANDEVAFRTLVMHDLSSGPAERIRLARAYLEAHPAPTPLGLELSRSLYHTAVLHPYLPDAERLDVLLFLGPRYKAWKVHAGVDATVRSLTALVSVSRGLRVEERQRALIMLRQLGGPRLTIRVTEVPSGPAALPPRLPLPFPEPTLPDDVKQASARRVEAATALLQNPNDLTARERLAAALQAEDLVRETFYDHSLAATPTPLGRLAVAWDRVRWRQLVVLVARRETGLSLVPAWEEEAEARTVALIKAWESLVAVLADYAAAQPDILWADQGRFELWSWVAWTGEWGLYPRYPWPYVAAQLARSQEDFFAHPDAPVRPWIVLDEGFDPPWYVMTQPTD